MAATWPAPPPTRILSWAQMVREADPGFSRQSLQPVVYEFSNRRVFVDPIPVYTPYAIQSDTGQVITDDLGAPIDQT